MKKVSIAYGDSRLEIKVPEYANVILPNYPASFDNPYQEIRQSILNPVNSASLKDLVNENDRIAVSICDVTRPMPSAVVLSAILDELHHINKNNIRRELRVGDKLRSKQPY